MTTENRVELELLRDSIRTLLERAGGLKRARRMRSDDKPWDAGVWRDLADAGVMAAGVPEDLGGVGMGLSAAGVVAEEIGRVIAPEPIVPTIGLAIGLLQRLCPDDPALPAVMVGETVMAVAWQERSPTGLSEDVNCSLDGAALNGSKDWVIGTEGAHQILVIARGDDGPALVRVAPDAPGLSRQLRKQADSSSLACLTFSGTPAEVLDTGERVADALTCAVAETTALAAAELVGLSGAALGLTLDYIKTREQFGKPIGSFQVIQHRAVDMYMMQEVARATVREVLAGMDQAGSNRERMKLASRAKARACTAAQKITREAIQLHGAVGYTDEFDIGLLLNRALVLSAWLGDARFHRSRWLLAKEAEETAQ